MQLAPGWPCQFGSSMAIGAPRHSLTRSISISRRSVLASSMRFTSLALSCTSRIVFVRVMQDCTSAGLHSVAASAIRIGGTGGSSGTIVVFWPVSDKQPASAGERAAAVADPQPVSDDQQGERR